MISHALSISAELDEMERNAYNAAFHELGFRWYWDSDTCDQLTQAKSSPAERIRHYLETRQAHLLKAYDAAFLVELIEQKKIQHRERGVAATALGSGYFDWAESVGGELGA